MLDPDVDAAAGDESEKPRFTQVRNLLKKLSLVFESAFLNGD